MDKRKVHISIVLIPNAMSSILSGIFEVLSSLPLLSTFDDAIPATSLFQVEFVASTCSSIKMAGGLPLKAHRAIADVEHTDVIIVPSVMVEPKKWQTGCFDEIVAWLSIMHYRGAVLCSACSGVLLLAETGLLDGKETTIHWCYASTFRQNFPNVHLRLEKMLVIAGEREQFIMSGASSSWTELILYIIARYVSPSAAQAVAKFFAFQWHADGQKPYLIFEQPIDHKDAMIRDAQLWLQNHFSQPAPVAEMQKRSGISERSFKRRFSKATGFSPIDYVQHLRIEEAKRRLEKTDVSIEKISWSIGYQDTSSFRRLFKRLTGITPGVYRQKFSLPDFVRN